MPTLPTVSMRRAVHDTIRGLVTRTYSGGNDFESDEFRDNRDTVRTGRRIGTGAIIAIVISVLFVSFCVLGCCVYSRRQKRRHERQLVEVKNDTKDSDASSSTYQNGSAPYPTYPNSGPGANNPVADPPPVYTPSHTSGMEKGPDGGAAGGHGIGHSGGHAGGL
ncbi:hypothetical protein DL768_005108 [Monosporascus sp. mg162]|nr:hypothetical protein DL768_005108 [Monosporascus sp. mg162]